MTPRNAPPADFPQADEVCSHLRAESARLSAQFGKPAIYGIADGWVYMRGEWRISQAWLLFTEGREEGQENRGFRLSTGGRSSRFEAWSAAGRMTFESQSMISTARITALINAVCLQDEAPRQ